MKFWWAPEKNPAALTQRALTLIFTVFQDDVLVHFKLNGLLKTTITVWEVKGHCLSTADISLESDSWLIMRHFLSLSLSLFHLRSTFSKLVLLVTVVTTASSFLKPTANAYALNCFGLHLLYILAIEMRWCENCVLYQQLFLCVIDALVLVPCINQCSVSLSLSLSVCLFLSQLQWPEGFATGQAVSRSVGSRHLLLD